MMEVDRFRALTRRVFDAEKPGFYSDWTTEQKSLYDSEDWKGFSRSRGYSEEEISECALWMEMIEQGKKEGFNPFGFIQDMSVEIAARNIAADKKGEILKSSHLPGEIKHGLTPEQFRAGIKNFESWMKNLPEALGEDPFPLEHTFAHGLYIRKCTVPADTLFVTKIHRHDDAAFLMRGDVEILEEGGFKRVQGPIHFVTKAGTKRVVYGHTESVMITVHAANGERDIEKLESKIFAKTFEELEQVKCLE